VVSSPKPPSPTATAAAQQRAEIGAAGASSVMNNPNIVNPYGSQSYSIAGWEEVPDAKGKMIKVPRYTQTQTLSPDQMKLLGLETQSQYNLGSAAVEQSAKMRDYLGKTMDTSGWANWNQGPSGGEVRQDQAPTDKAGVQKAMMDLYGRQSQGKNTAEMAQMAAKGLNPGSTQYGATAKRQGDEYTDAALKAYLASGEESRASQDSFNRATQQRFDMGGAEADRANALRGMQAQEGFAMRNQPINEITALMSGGQVTMPQFSPYQGQSINPANIAQMIQSNYMAQAANAANTNSGIFGVGANIAGAIPWSDRRLKQDIVPMNIELAGAPMYTFRYKAFPHIIHVGVMADEVRELHPDAIIPVGEFDTVDYDMLKARHKGEIHHELGW